MNGELAGIEAYFQSLQQSLEKGRSGAEVIIAPPMAFLGPVAEAVKVSPGVKLAAQNVAAHASGAFTGETSAAMLKQLGCTYSLIGHSERRALYGEDDVQVLQKAQQLLAQQLVPILCVGETLAQREAGEAEAVVKQQVMAVIAELKAEERERLVIAYEPVWAIGTGKTATPEQAQAMHGFIRQTLSGVDEALAEELEILYGGSVNAANAQALFAQQDIDGGLVGGASLKANEFSQICEAIG